MDLGAVQRHRGTGRRDGCRLTPVKSCRFKTKVLIELVFFDAKFLMHNAA